MPIASTPVKLKYGLQAKYDALAVKDLNTIYVITDSQRIFVGEIEYTRPLRHGSALPTGYNPPNSIFILEQDGKSSMYYSKDGFAWVKIGGAGGSDTDFPVLTTGLYGSNMQSSINDGTIQIPEIAVNGEGKISSVTASTFNILGKNSIPDLEPGEYGANTQEGIDTTRIVHIPVITVGDDKRITSVESKFYTIDNIVAQETPDLPVGVFGDNAQTTVDSGKITIPQITVNDHKRISNVTEVEYTLPTMPKLPANGTFGTNVQTDVTAGTINVPVVTVTDGKITSVTSSSLTLPDYTSPNELPTGTYGDNTQSAITSNKKLNLISVTVDSDGQVSDISESEFSLPIPEAVPTITAGTFGVNLQDTLTANRIIKVPTITVGNNGYISEITETSLTIPGISEEELPTLRAGQYGYNIQTEVNDNYQLKFPAITVNADGRISDISNDTVTIPIPDIPNIPTVTAGVFGTNSQTTVNTAKKIIIPKITVGDDGYVSGIESTELTLPGVSEVDLPSLTTGEYGSNAQATTTNNKTIVIPKITVNDNGRVSAITESTLTLPIPTIPSLSSGTFGTNVQATVNSTRVINVPSITVGSDGFVSGISTTAITIPGISESDLPTLTAGIFGTNAQATVNSSKKIKIPKVVVNDNGRISGLTETEITLPTLTLPSLTAGTYGSNTQAAITNKTIAIPSITVNSDGKISAVASTSFTLPTPTAADIGIPTLTAGTFGTNTQTTISGGSITIPKLTVNSEGHISSIVAETFELSGGSLQVQKINNPQLVPSSNLCTWTINPGLNRPITGITLKEVATNELVLADIQFNADNTQFSILITSTTNIAANKYQVSFVV